MWLRSIGRKHTYGMIGVGEHDETMKKCAFCKAPMKEDRIEHVHRWEGKLYLLQNVPAEVCSQCGEVFFGPDVLKAMDGVVMQKDKSEGQLSIPVFSL